MSTILNIAEALVFIFTVVTIMSYALGVTPIFRFSSSLGFGVAVGFVLVPTIRTIYNLGIAKVLDSQYIYLLWILIGLLAVMRVIPKYFIFARPAMAYLYGIMMAVTLRGTIYTELLGTFGGWATYNLANPSTIVLYLGLVACLSYFVWTRRLSIHERGFIGVIPEAGRLLFLFHFGEQLISLGFKRYSSWSSLITDLINYLRILGVPIP